MWGGVISVCIARTEEGLRNRERVLGGVGGEDGCLCDVFGDSMIDMSLSEPLEVLGELCREGRSKTASSGSLEWRAEPETETSSSSSP